MTDHGKAYVISRLSQCPDLASLQRVWGNIGVEYQRNVDVVAHKDALKAGMS